MPIQSTRFAIQHFPTIPTNVLCTINTVGMAYEATGNMPLTTSLASGGNGGINAESANECASGGADSGTNRAPVRRYNPSPKHDQGGKGTPMDLDPQTAQKVLNDGYLSGKRVWGYFEGKIYAFQPEGNGVYHGYPEAGFKAPTAYLRQLRDTGVISNSEYRKLTQQGRP